MTQRSTSGLNFRFDINALRAFAIFGVLFFHYKISFFSGGFAGVDVFFVISGYLMTRIIVKSIDKNEFSFKEYLGKRLKRIVPALLFMILTLMLICFFAYLPEDYKSSQQNAAGSILFVSNILYWLHAGSYFSAASDTNILLHTWSLSVEWQFYLIYPFFLLLLHRFFKRRSNYLIFLTGLTFAIFFTSIYLTQLKATASFYLLPTRAWEMLFGGIAFFSENFVREIFWRKILAVTGYTVILACFVFLKVSMAWPGFYTLLPVAATFAVIIANVNEFKFIRFSTIQFVGKISYSLYLWHWPVYILAQYFGVKADPGSAAVLTLLSVLLAYLSFRYIEIRTFGRRQKIIVAMTVTFLSAAALGYFDANRFIFKDKTLEIADYSRAHATNIDKQFSRGNCFVEPGNEKFNKDSCLCIYENKRNVLLLGDSHAAQLALSLREKLAAKNVHLLQATAGGIFPSVYRIDDKELILRTVFDFTFQNYIPTHAKKIDAVIFTAHWALYKDMPNEEILRQIREVIHYFGQHDIPVIVLGQIESYIISYQTMAAKNYQYDIPINKGYLDDDSYVIDAYLRKNLGKDYVSVINTDSFPPLSPRNEPYMWDRNHVTKYGADLLIDKMLAQRPNL